MSTLTRSFPNSFSSGSSALALGSFCFTTGGSGQTERRTLILFWTSRVTRAPAYWWQGGILVAALRVNTRCGRLPISAFAAFFLPSFADIFANNSAKNGFLTVCLKESEAYELMRRSRDIKDYQLTIDLEPCEVRDEEGFAAKFPIDEFVRHCLLNGLDDIGLTLQHESEITAYEVLHPAPSALQTPR